MTCVYTPGIQHIAAAAATAAAAAAAALSQISESGVCSAFLGIEDNTFLQKVVVEVYFLS